MINSRGELIMLIYKKKSVVHVIVEMRVKNRFVYLSSHNLAQTCYMYLHKVCYVYSVISRSNSFEFTCHVTGI